MRPHRKPPSERGALATNRFWRFRFPRASSILSAVLRTPLEGPAPYPARPADPPDLRDLARVGIDDLTPGVLLVVCGIDASLPEWFRDSQRKLALTASTACGIFMADSVCWSLGLDEAA